MLFRDNIFTVHAKADAKDPSERIVLVREGFSIGAFIFTILWLLTHRLWAASALFFVLMFAVAKAILMFQMNPVMAGALQLGLQFWLGATARDMQRESLARRGYKLTDIVVAESQLMGARRYYDRHQAA